MPNVGIVINPGHSGVPVQWITTYDRNEMETISHKRGDLKSFCCFSHLPPKYACHVNVNGQWSFNVTSPDV